MCTVSGTLSVQMPHYEVKVSTLKLRELGLQTCFFFVFLMAHVEMSLMVALQACAGRRALQGGSANMFE